MRRIFVGGEWVPSTTGDVIEVVNPATEQVIGTVPAGGADDIDMAVTAARTAGERWARDHAGRARRPCSPRSATVSRPAPTRPRT